MSEAAVRSGVEGAAGGVSSRHCGEEKLVQKAASVIGGNDREGVAGLFFVVGIGVEGDFPFEESIEKDPASCCYCL